MVLTDFIIIISRFNGVNLIIYNLAFAQEKCGSGFDVSAAVYGTQMYTRFDPEGMIKL